jgi:LysM repeat protein
LQGAADVVTGTTKDSTNTVQPLDTSTQVYVVQRGDTLFSIAKRYGTTVDALVKINKLASRNYIRTGQQLLVPKLA